MNCIKLSATSAKGGALRTMSLVIPVNRVMLAGIDRSGLTSECHSPMISWLRIFTAPISVIRSPFAELPVVSMSTTT